MNDPVSPRIQANNWVDQSFHTRILNHSYNLDFREAWLKLPDQCGI